MDAFAPGDNSWLPFQNGMLDVYGRDWGTSLVARLMGTSFATPRSGSVGAMILEAHLEITFTSYTGRYFYIDHCATMLVTSEGADGVQQIASLAPDYLDTNYCSTPQGFDAAGGANKFKHVTNVLPDPQGCTRNAAYYGTAVGVTKCEMGYWHNDGLQCPECGSKALTAMWSRAGDAEAVTAATTMFNRAYRPMFQTKLANINKANPAAYEAYLPYHLLYLSQFQRRTFLEEKAEGETTSTGTKWFKPHSLVVKVYASLCGGGYGATSDYKPGFLVKGVSVRPCCPMCVPSTPEGPGVISLSCKWPHLYTLTCVGGGSGCGAGQNGNILVALPTQEQSNSVEGKPDYATMLLSRMSYDVAAAVKTMKGYIEQMSGAGLGGGTFVTTGRPVFVEAPAKLGLIVAGFKAKYLAATTTPYWTAADELYAGSPAIMCNSCAVNGLMLEVYTAVAGAQVAGPKFPVAPPGLAVPAMSSYSGDGSLIYLLGCATAQFWQGMPYCILGAGLYDWSAGAASGLLAPIGGCAVACATMDPPTFATSAGTSTGASADRGDVSDAG
jgi:hypothetical protein